MLEKIYVRFIDTGKIPNKVLEDIAIKIIGGRGLSDKETTVFYNKTSEINEIIRKLNKKNEK